MAITYIGTTGSTTDLTTYTFNTVNIGTAATDRFVLIGVTGRANGAGLQPKVSSASIGGIFASVGPQRFDDSNVTAFIWATVPTGSTATVIVTFNMTMTNCDIWVWKNNGFYLCEATGISSANPLTTSINETKGGFGVAIAKSDDGATSAAWSGLTENFDTLDSQGNNVSGASAEFTTTATGATITCTWGSSIRPVFTAITFNTGGSLTNVSSISRVNTIKI